MFKRYWWMFFVMVPLGAFVGLLVAAGITYMMPKQYESEAVIQVMPRHQPPTMGTPVSQAPPQSATEAEILKSRKVLEQVAANLDFPNRWNVDMETAIRILKGIVEIQRINGTDLISIRARHTNRIDARDIAGELVAVHKANRAETDARESELYIQEINKMVLDQEDKVEERRKVLSTIVRTKGIIYKGHDGVQQEELLKNDGTDKDEEREKAIRRSLDAQDYVDAKRDFETDQELLQQMKLKLVGEKISRKMVLDNVRIHDKPVIAQVPCSPNVTLNLLLGTGVGFLLSPLMALPLMWLLNRRRPAHAAG
jgi:capsular polysaccharide biosynthesis protein